MIITKWWENNMGKPDLVVTVNGWFSMVMEGDSYQERSSAISHVLLWFEHQVLESEDRGHERINSIAVISLHDRPQYTKP